ncbi:uncharacterized protein LOC102713349 [Oryza brachyantha]|uniref:Uncharacterized protein n=1 Tax=Oryza brachyantha TaxID=4533 RepID=J3M1L3_ORYBR|nr:uncharacterized protein LOC102713349 [Oryza brachyantha]
MTSEGNKTVTPNEPPTMEQASSSGAKRKRGCSQSYEYGMHESLRSSQPIQSVNTDHNASVRSSRPRDSTNLLKTSLSQASNHSGAPLQGNSVKDDIVGKYFVGKMSKKFPGFSLITVKVKDNQVLKGWIPDENNLRPITPKDDLAPDLPMLRPSQVRKRPSNIYRQAAGQDVTFAKPLQMRRPDEKSVAK